MWIVGCLIIHFFVQSENCFVNIMLIMEVHYY